MRKSAVAVILILGSIVQIQGFPNGAPSSVCASMTPGHGVGTQQSASPFITATPDGVIKRLVEFVEFQYLLTTHYRK